MHHICLVQILLKCGTLDSLIVKFIKINFFDKPRYIERAQRVPKPTTQTNLISL